MIKLLLAASLMMGSTACTANQLLQSAPVVGKVCAAADQTLIDNKVVGTATALYVAAATVYKAVNEAGELSPAAKAKVKPLLIEMYRYVGVIKAAKGAVNCDFASMKSLYAQVIVLLPKRT